jgi:hypothetical protein
MNLQKLAEKINERWGEDWYAEEQHGWGIDIKHPTEGSRVAEYEVVGDDLCNGQWIIWCLDRLEELHKPNPMFGLTFSVDMLGRELGDGDGEDYCIQVVAYPRNGDDHAVDTTYPISKTRAEAVTLALAKALGVEDE